MLMVRHPGLRMDIEHLHLTANGQSFYLAAAGPRSGPPVFLLHGFPEMSYAWRHQLAALAEAGMRVMAPDQRGYGHSSKPSDVGAYRLDTLGADIVALASELGYSSARLVGHDWGGLVAWLLATHNPGFVDRLAILNAPHPATLMGHMVRRPSQALRSAYVAFFQLPWIPEAALGTLDHALLEAALVRTSRPGTFDDDELAVYRAAWSIDGALTGMLNWYRALALAPSLDRRRVTCPVRILWGDRDAALDQSLAELAATRCEVVEVIHLPQATHWLHHEEHRRVNELLIDFLQ